MAVSANDAISKARSLLGTPYGSGKGKLDCINLIKRIIRECPGGQRFYTTSGSNGLWGSREASEKYRDIVAWRELHNGDSGRAGEVLAMIHGNSCDHVGLAIGDGTVIHASKSNGATVCTDVAGHGWTHALVHRYIDVEIVESGSPGMEGTVFTVCAKGGLRQRKEPSLDGEYMQMVPDGAHVEVMRVEDDWGLVLWKGHYGWVSMEYLYAPGDD